MKKSGFTLIELLAVIVIIGIIALISTPVVLNIIDSTRKEAFKNSVLSVFKATELYETKNDFEKISNDGINIKDESLPLENGGFTSGKIIRNANDNLEVVNITDGVYCAKGTKDNIILIKGSCDEFDETAPTDTKIIISNVTSNSFRVVVNSIDDESGIKNYSYSIDGINFITTTSNNYTFNNLSMNKKYMVYVRITNNNGITTETVTEEINTKELNEPTYSVDSSGWQQQKIVTINFPEREQGFVYSYSIDGGNTWETLENETTANVTFTTNGNIIARIYDGTNYKTASTYTVSGIDTTAPSASVELSNKTTNTITVKAAGTDTESGIIKYEFSIDNGTYVLNGTNDTYTFTNVTEGNHSIKVRVTNGSGLTTESITLTASPNKITVPTYEVDKTGWQVEKIVTITYSELETGFVYSYSIDSGNTWTTVSSGTTANVTFTTNGSVIARVYDGTNYKTASTYTVSGIDTTAPSASVELSNKTTNTITVKAAGTDSESGITKYEFSINNGTYVNNGTNDTYTFTSVTEGNHIVRVRVTNGSGLTTESITLTASPNEITEPIYGIDKTGWQTRKVVTIAYPERQPGFTYSYSINGGTSWTILESGTTANVIFTSNGSVIARVYDGTNYKTASSYTVNQIDTTAPVASVVYKKEDGTPYISDTWTNQSVIATLSATETQSGVAKYQVTYEGAQFHDVVGSTLTYSGPRTGIWFRAIDNAGNVGPLTGTYLIAVDKIAPAIPSVPDLITEHDTGNNTDNITIWWNNIKITGTAEANSTIHLRNLNVSNDIIAITTANASGYWETHINTTQNAWSSIYVWSGDIAGNWSYQSTPLNIYSDTIAPIVKLNGNSTVTVEKGSTYTELGATATDSGSGISGSVTITGNVNTSAVGTYVLTYKVMDNVGNVSSITRTVNVVQTIPDGWIAVRTPADLYNIRNNLTANYFIANDINLTGTSYSEWTPINGFYGNLDGGGNKIIGLRMTNSYANEVGLFGYIPYNSSNATTIKNLQLVDVYILGYNGVGAVAGKRYQYGNLTLENINVTGTIKGYTNVGGLIGQSQAILTIKNSVSNSAVESTYQYAGGLAGYTDSADIIDSYSTGTVKGTNYVGGLIGYHSGGSVNNSYTTGTVTGTNYVGGLIGETCIINGNNVYSRSNVIATGSHIGGLIGRQSCSSSGTINLTKGYATGNVTGISNVGGLFGSNTGIVISRSYWTGNITATANYEQETGGISGYNNGGTINDCYSAGNIHISGTESSNYVGGIVGTNHNGSIIRVYSASKITGIANNIGPIIGRNLYGSAHGYFDSTLFGPYYGSYGTALSTSAMYLQSSFIGFDFTNIWYASGTSYITLR